MILGIGIDSVEISRFNHWHTYPLQSLRRIFSEQEIEYCLSSQACSAERFAARFAAREALLKALSQAFPNQSFSLLALCKAVTIHKNPNGAPYLTITWPIIGLAHEPDIQALISWTHTAKTATAIIMLQASGN